MRIASCSVDCVAKERETRETVSWSLVGRLVLIWNEVFSLAEKGFFVYVRKNCTRLFPRFQLTWPLYIYTRVVFGIYKYMTTISTVQVFFGRWSFWYFFNIIFYTEVWCVWYWFHCILLALWELHWCDRGNCSLPRYSVKHMRL